MSGEIFIMGGGGGGRPYAFIIVNYPEGSTVTCNNINGKKELSSTKILFYVKKPSSGSTVNCEVSCSNSSSQSASQTVSITSEGQSKTVTLAYEFVIFDGTLNSAMGSMVKKGDNLGGSTWDIYSKNLRLVSSDNYPSQRGYVTGCFTNGFAVDASRRYLSFTVVTSDSGSLQQIGVSTNNNADSFNKSISPGSVSSSSPKTFTIDLNDYIGSTVYFKVYSWGGNTIRLSKVWAKKTSG